MNGWRGVLFDKDGTLIDFHNTWVPATVDTAAAMAALAHPDAAHQDQRTALVARLVGLIGYDIARLAAADPAAISNAGARIIARRVLDPASLLARGSLGEIAAIWAREPELRGMRDAIERIGAEFRERAVRSAAPLCPLEPLFGRLRARGLRLGVATMDTTLSAEMTFSGLGVDHLLDFVAGFDGGHGEKPGPGMVHGFCAAVGIAPAEVVVVGDSLHDLDMAKAAEAGLAVAVLSGVAGHDHLSHAADHVIAGIDALEDLLDRVPAPSRAKALS